MTPSFAIKCVAILALLAGATSSFSHISLDEPVALAGSGYKAVLRVGHGCEGSPVTAVRVSIPAGFRGAKPMPKPGWVLSIKTGRLDQAYESHGKQVTEDVIDITWTARSSEHWLPDGYFDEFALRGTLPSKAGAMWFKVLQTCEQGSIHWAEVPPEGTATHGLTTPAALLDIIGSGAVGGHQH